MPYKYQKVTVKIIHYYIIYDFIPDIIKILAKQIKWNAIHMTAI